MAVAIFDFPLVFLMQHTRAGACILYGCLEPSPIPNVVFIPVVGTLIYAAFGFFACILARSLFRQAAILLKGRAP